MKNTSILLVMTLLLAMSTASFSQWYSENFEGYTVGDPVADWYRTNFTVEYDGETHSDTGNQVYCYDAGTGGISNWYSAEGADYTDFTFISRWQCWNANAGYAGPLFRYINGSKYYRVQIGRTLGTRLMKLDGGVLTELARGTYEYTPGDVVWIKVVCIGTNIKIYQSPDGVSWVKEIDTVDSFSSHGKIGLWAQGHTHIDDMSVSEPPAIEWYSDDFESYAIDAFPDDWSSTVLTVNYAGESMSDTSNQVYRNSDGSNLSTYDGGVYSDFIYQATNFGANFHSYHSISTCLEDQSSRPMGYLPSKT